MKPVGDEMDFERSTVPECEISFADRRIENQIRVAPINFQRMSDDDHEEAIDFVRRQYLQQIPPRYFKWPKSTACIQSSLWDHVFRPGIHKFPPGDRYQYLILRDLITKLDNQELDDSILMRYMIFLQNLPPIVPPTMETVVTYTIPQVGEIYISEQPSLLVSGGTTGMRTWEASFLLSEWLLEQDIKGKRVLELGAGTGLVGILAAKCGAKVMATDGSETVVMNIRENFELNDVIAETRTLWWGEEDEILKQEWDLVLGADITYDEGECTILASTYALSLKNGGIGIVAATVRNENTLKAFVHECGIHALAEPELTPEMIGLLVEEIPGRDSLDLFLNTTAFPMRLWQIQFTGKYVS